MRRVSAQSRDLLAGGPHGSSIHLSQLPPLVGDLVACFSGFFFVCLYNGEHSQSWSHYEIIGLKTPAEGWRLLSVPAAELPWELATAVRPCQLLNTWEPQLPRLFDKVIRVSPQTTDPSIKGENAR